MKKLKCSMKIGFFDNGYSFEPKNVPPELWKEMCRVCNDYAKFLNGEKQKRFK
jgi:hypothetical protein